LLVVVAAVVVQCSCAWGLRRVMRVRRSARQCAGVASACTCASVAGAARCVDATGAPACGLLCGWCVLLRARARPGGLGQPGGSGHGWWRRRNPRAALPGPCCIALQEPAEVRAGAVCPRMPACQRPVPRPPSARNCARSAVYTVSLAVIKRRSCRGFEPCAHAERQMRAAPSQRPRSFKAYCRPAALKGAGGGPPHQRHSPTQFKCG
jgi:hypothetical protein